MMEDSKLTKEGYDDLLRGSAGRARAIRGMVGHTYVDVENDVRKEPKQTILAEIISNQISLNEHLDMQASNAERIAERLLGPVLEQGEKRSVEARVYDGVMAELQGAQDRTGELLGRLQAALERLGGL